jgi:uncharacterized protein YceK
MASWRIQAALVGLLAVCGCGTADNFLHFNEADGPTPYGGVRRDWDQLTENFENVIDPDDPIECAFSAATATAMLVDLPLSAIFDTLTYYPASQGWGASEGNGAAGKGSPPPVQQTGWRAAERPGFNR